MHIPINTIGVSEQLVIVFPQMENDDKMEEGQAMRVLDNHQTRNEVNSSRSLTNPSVLPVVILDLNVKM